MQRGIVQVCIDLRRIQTAVAQNLLQCAGIHAVFQHQRRRRVAQLMRRITARVQAGGEKLLFQHILNCAGSHSASFLTDKQGFFVGFFHIFVISDRQIVVNGLSTALSKEYHTLFVAFTEYAYMILIYVCYVQGYKL